MSDQDYLHSLIQERDSLQQQGAFPNAVKLLEKEIRQAQSTGEPVLLTDKVFVPVDKYPDYNFIGRILGPKGMYLKRLEGENQCRLFIRGAGSLRDRIKEDRLKAQPGNEHLTEPLHVAIHIQQPEPLASELMKKARAEIEKLMIPVDEKEDRVKWEQLSELKHIRESERSTDSRPSYRSGSEPRGYGPDRSYNRGDSLSNGRPRYDDDYADRGYRATSPRSAPYPERASYPPARTSYATPAYEPQYAGGYASSVPRSYASVSPYADPPYREPAPPPPPPGYAPASYEPAPLPAYSHPQSGWSRAPY